ncbi:branched-chain amino acid ABC transporter substrate-binding protein [Noviherbaspirillum sedimenti]|uniref:Branched-chain amino acid ABC transporter substrate-binding protein n=1 Tax=Noviherbaspirillum sedimenti TaxID=2320865 RepID=A0A3A3GU73_9BURK|nr:branched-chain amino acid ABC transporter substrate-binding protein [Noviherbaspirillum sedimenti]
MLLTLASAVFAAPAATPTLAPPIAPVAPIRIGMIEGVSGPFGNAGEAVRRNLLLAIERINARGGVRLPQGHRPLALTVFDNKQGVEESLIAFRQVSDQGIPFIAQGNSSAVAAALVDAVNKHNARMPAQRVLFLNYAAVDPVLTNETCSFWHFRFDAHADMRMHALTEAIRADTRARRIYLIGQDYSFGRQVALAARTQLAAKRPDIAVVGDELHPIGRVKDFAPYIAKIKASGADTVITGNWGNDLTLLVKAARDAGLALKFYTFYGNSLGAPAAIGDAGVEQVRAVAEWHPNVGGAASDAFYREFRQRYPQPADDYVHLRMQLMIEMLAAAIEKARTTEAAAVARALEGAEFRNAFHQANMRATDHQLIQPLYVSVMKRAGDGTIRFDNEGSGYGFKTERYLPGPATALPTSCKMVRPK